MEKYSGWNDPTTGINPFVPSVDRRGIVGKLLQFTFGGVLCVFRLSFVLAFFLLLVVWSTLVSLIPVRGLQYPLRRLLESPLSRLILLFLGYYSISSTVPAGNQIRLRRSPSKPSASVKSGDIVFANHTSFTDVLYLSFRYAPTFARTSIKGGMQERTVIGALIDAISPPRNDLPPGCKSESVVAAHQGLLKGPVACFPEGVRTNNLGILAFTPTANEVAAALRAMKGDSRPTVHVVVFRHPQESCHTIGNAIVHVLKLTSRFYNTMTVSRLPEFYMPQPSDPVPSSDGEPVPPNVNDYQHILRNAMLQLIKSARGLSISAADYSSFHAFYHGATTAREKKA